MKRLYPALRRSFFEDVTALGGAALTTLLALFVFFLNIVPLWYQVTLGLIIIPVVSVVIRHFYFRPRPRIEPHTTWAEKMYASSFPSIHSARIWFVAAMLSLSLKNPFIAIVLLLVAFLVSYSRVTLEKHDSIDGVAGTVLGLVVAAMMLMVG